jgi:hypothetical protein
VGSSVGWVKPKTIKLVFACFSAKHAALRRKLKVGSSFSFSTSTVSCTFLDFKFEAISKYLLSEKNIKGKEY